MDYPTQNPGVIQLPANHNIVGTCGVCGGPVVSPMMWAGTGNPPEHCHNCGRVPKVPIAHTFGPIRDMLEKPN